MNGFHMVKNDINSACVMECGGKRSATPLFQLQDILSSFSKRCRCHRSPKRPATDRAHLRTKQPSLPEVQA